MLDVVASTPREGLVPALLENLARGVRPERHGPAQVRLVRCFDDGHRQQLAAWPDRAGAELAPEGSRTVDVPGLGVLVVDPAPRMTSARARLLRETAAWLGAIVRALTATRELRRAQEQAHRAGAAAEAAQLRAVRVGEGERIRLVETVTTATVGDLAELRGMLAVPAGEVPWERVNASAERLIDELRGAVRGVFPAMLPERGAAETLAELASGLPGSVVVRGDLGRRAGWDVESGFYHAVAGVLRVLARGPERVEVRLRGGDALVARVTRRTGGLADALAGDAAVAEVEAALAADRERLASLGGTLRVGPGREHVEVVVSLPTRAEVTSLPPGRRQLASRPVHGRVATLLESAGLPETVRERLRVRLTAPVALLVVQGPSPVPAPGVRTIDCDEAPDAALAARIRSGEEWGGVDAVVCALSPRDGFAAALAGGPLLFADGTGPGEAVALLAARAPVIAAVRVADELARIAEDEGENGVLRWQLEQLVVGAHELAEHGLLDAVAEGRAPRIVDADAARLAGSAGGDARTRLGLDRKAGDDLVAATAAAAAAHWAAVARRPGLDAASRRAAELLARSAAGIGAVPPASASASASA
ncbi:hypothetical protein D9V30_08610 [Mycetocola reblochoni]|uniref:Uncharacterized protein n=1 Tax=Mycetocola reblochoni TaxID=331618 RepID=A0A3L6ZM20_9MICO|nr:hypothetical protein D9V30_08610 [Mycetocola reblochoni]